MERDCRLCCNCDQPAVVVHHIVPRSLGGRDHIRNLISLCDECHGLIHGADFTKQRRMLKASIEHRRATGGKLGGRQRSYGEDQAELVRELAAAGRSRRKIQSATGLSQGTIDRILKTANTAAVMVAEMVA